MLQYFTGFIMLVREFFVKNKTIIMPQPTYSPDLASADFFLFLKTEDTDKRKLFCLRT